MIVRHLFYNLSIDLVNQQAIDYRYSFNLKTVHICNYIERNCLKPLKFKSDKFQGIGFDLRHGYEENFMNVEPFISPNKSLAIVSAFNKERYDALKSDDDFREFVYEYLLESLKKAEDKFEIPTAEILKSYHELKENHFINEWLFKKKTIKEKLLLVELKCALTIEHFVLTLIVSKNKKEVFKKVIEKTKPGYYDMYDLLGDIIITDNELRITNRLGKKISVFDLNKF